MKKCTRSIGFSLALVLLASLYFVTANAANQVPPAVPSPSETSVKASEAIVSGQLIPTGDSKINNNESAAEIELKILKEKNLLIAEFQGSLISIVVWSLSAVVSIVLLLVGASLFTSFKLHEKDIQRIQMDYDAKIKVFQSEMEADLAIASRDVAAAQEIRSQQDLNRMLDQTSQIRSHFETVRASLEDKFDELLKNTASFDVTVNNLKNDQVGFIAELRKVESAVWKIRKIPVNFIISTLQGLDAALLSGKDYVIDEFIEEIKSSLRVDFVESGQFLDKELLGIFERRLSKLSSVRPNDEQEIRTLLAQCANSNADSQT